MGLILRGVTEWTRDKHDWALGHRRFLAPTAHDYLVAILDEGEREDVLAAHHRRILRDDDEAAKRWFLYEQHFSHPVPAAPVGDEGGLPPDYAHRARLHVHYWANSAFLDPTRMERAVAALRNSGLPMRIVQGSLDLVCLSLYAANLARQLPHAALHVVPGAGHAAGSPLMAEALRNAVQHLSPTERTTPP